MVNKKCCNKCKKIIFKFQYIFTDAELTRFPSTNNLSDYFVAYILSTDKKITIANFYADTNNTNQFQENWTVTDQLGNQISFGGFSNVLRGGISADGSSFYSVSSILGEKWENVNLIEIKFNEDLTRDIYFYQVC
jgi:hypothetical protein